MKIANSMFIKVLVLNYYKRNALLLLIILLFAFGFLSGNEHMAIIRSIISSPKSFVYVILLWLIYDIVIIGFVLKQLGLPSFKLLYHLQLFSKKTELLVLAKSQFNLLHLTNFYAVFIISVSVLDKIYWPIIFIILYKLIAVFIASIIYLKRLTLPPDGNLINFNLNISFMPKIKSYFGAYFSGYLFQSYAITFLIVKLFSILLLDFFFWIYPTDAYDFRLFGLAVIIVSVANIKLLQLYFEFEKSFLQFTFNLPLSILKRYCFYALNLFWVLSPDILTFVWKAKFILDFSQILSWSLFYFFLAMIILEFIFTFQKKQELSGQILFFLMVGLSLLIMYQSNLYILAFIMLGVSVFLYNQRIMHKKRDL